jgi:hypothetical protein
VAPGCTVGPPSTTSTQYFEMAVMVVHVTFVDVPAAGPARMARTATLANVAANR